MNRSKNILEMALKNSGILNSAAVSQVESVSSNGERENMPLSTCFMETGQDLLQFKHNLRPRNLVNVITENNESECSEEEPFSADVSEYVPSTAEGRKDNVIPEEEINELNGSVDQEERQKMKEVDQENQIKENVLEINQPGTSSHIENKPSLMNIKKETSKKKRNMPKKCNPGRKRNRNPEIWKCNINKKKKNLGQEFTNFRGKLMRRREMKSGCTEKCSRKCIDKVTVEMRTKIFTDFWALGDHNNQIQFVSRCVERVPKKQVTLSTIHTSRRQWSYKYSFSVGGSKIQICKKMCFDTLDITDKWVTTIYKKIDSQEHNVVVLDDQRGHHNNRPRQIAADIKATVRTHIAQVPVVDAHYVRARSQKQYFEETLTFTKLYKLYKEWLEENGYDPELTATERQYRDIFYNEYNIDFFKPKNDQCPTCDIYNKATIDEKESLKGDYTVHIASKNIVRELKEYYKNIAQNSNSVVLASYDMQKILSTPMSEVSLFYYKRKLAVYNLTVFDVGMKEGFCYVWDETTGNKGANEISSAIYLFIQMKVKEGFKDFYFLSDNCGGQNRNRIVFYMYSYAAKKFNININHTFFEVGHTQNEGDSMHALIEKRKNNQTIYVPHQWITLIKCAKSSGKPYIVTELGQNAIYNFKILMQQQVNFDFDTNNSKIKWSKTRHVKIDAKDPQVIGVMYDVLSEKRYYIDLTKMPLARITRKSKTTNKVLVDTDLKPAYNVPLSISRAKYKDLNSLCDSKVVPEMYHKYFKDLKHGDLELQGSDSD